MLRKRSWDEEDMLLNIMGRNASYAMAANIVNAMVAHQAIVNLNYVADVGIGATSILANSQMINLKRIQ